MSLTRENYYEYRHEQEGELVISNSALSHINPDEGGSRKRFINFINGTAEKEESKSLDRGKLLHSYLEDPENFVMLPEDTPSDDVCAILRRVHREITLAGVAPGALAEHVDVLITIAREVRYGGNWGTDTIIRKIREKGDAYFKYLCDSQGKFMTDAKTKLILEGICNGLVTNGYTKQNYIDGVPGTMKELPILFQYQDFVCKALLDNCFVDFSSKTAIIRDIKSTRHPVGQYLGHHVVKDSYEGVKREWVSGPFVWYRTYRQLAFYDIALRQWLCQQGELGHKYHIEHEVLACETIDPYEHTVYKIDKKWIKAGYQEVEQCFIALQSELNGNETFNNSAAEQRN